MYFIIPFIYHLIKLSFIKTIYNYKNIIYIVYNKIKKIKSSEIIIPSHINKGDIDKNRSLRFVYELSEKTTNYFFFPLTTN